MTIVMKNISIWSGNMPQMLMNLEKVESKIIVMRKYFNLVQKHAANGHEIEES
jgi:hypothetical protein